MSYDAVADSYSRVFDEGADDPALAELLGEVTGQTVLSLCCGQGRDARMLARLGGRVTGVDVSGEMLRFAREHEAAAPLGIAYAEDDAQQLSTLADTSFDGVLCHMALMDVPDLSAAVRSVARVLRDGGWFVFSIVHPAYHPHVEIVNDYLLDHRYAKHVPVDWLPPHAYHRPLARYVNDLAAYGLRLERLLEVHQHAPNDPVSDRAQRDAGGVPGLLYARAEKR